MGWIVEIPEGEAQLLTGPWNLPLAIKDRLECADEPPREFRRLIGVTLVNERANQQGTQTST